MANPNLLNITSITAQKKVGTLTTGSTGFQIVNLSSSDTLVKVISIYLTNKTTSTVSINAWQDGVHFADALDLPPETTIQLVSKDAPLYVLEGSNVSMSCSNASSVDAVCAYEVMG